MKKWIICSLAIILIISIQNNSFGQSIKLLKTTHLSYFPSASSLEFYNNRLYVFGDDAPQMLVLDKEHKPVDSLKLFSSNKNVIDKKDKADIESSFLFTKKGKTSLVAIGSFSTGDRRELIQIAVADKLNVKKIKKGKKGFINKKIKDPNIEGATLIRDKLVLANRANLSTKINYLLVSQYDGKNLLRRKQQRIITVTLPESKDVKGVSGLSYVDKDDLLLITISTEKTENAVDDGEIGESYLGIIKDASKKLLDTAIKPEYLLPLYQLLGTKKHQKIESVTVESATGNEYILHIAADNDNGESTLFKISLKL